MMIFKYASTCAVCSGRISTETAEYTLFISQTNSSSLVIYQVEQESDSLVMTHYQSFDERVEVADFIQTADGGISILAGIHILGKYRRPVVVKMPEEQFIPEE